MFLLLASSDVAAGQGCVNERDLALPFSNWTLLVVLSRLLRTERAAAAAGTKAAVIMLKTH